MKRRLPIYLTLAMATYCSWGLTYEGLSEKCHLNFFEQKQQAQKAMRKKARSACRGFLRQKTKTAYDRFVLQCEGPERVFGVAATAQFDCTVPFSLNTNN